MAKTLINFDGKQFADTAALEAYVNQKQAELTARLAAAESRAKPERQEPTNCEIRQDGSIFTIRMDLSKSFGLSSTGKTVTVGSTHGNRVYTLPNGRKVSLGITAFHKDLKLAGTDGGANGE